MRSPVLLRGAAAGQTSLCPSPHRGPQGSSERVPAGPVLPWLRHPAHQHVKTTLCPESTLLPPPPAHWSAGLMPSSRKPSGFSPVTLAPPSTPGPAVEGRDCALRSSLQSRSDLEMPQCRWDPLLSPGVSPPIGFPSTSKCGRWWLPGGSRPTHLQPGHTSGCLGHHLALAAGLGPGSGRHRCRWLLAFLARVRLWPHREKGVTTGMLCGKTHALPVHLGVSSAPGACRSFSWPLGKRGTPSPSLLLCNAPRSEAQQPPAYSPGLSSPHH